MSTESSKEGAPRQDPCCERKVLIPRELVELARSKSRQSACSDNAPTTPARASDAAECQKGCCERKVLIPREMVELARSTSRQSASSEIAPATPACGSDGVGCRKGGCEGGPEEPPGSTACEEGCCEREAVPLADGTASGGGRSTSACCDRSLAPPATAAIPDAGGCQEGCCTLEAKHPLPAEPAERAGGCCERSECGSCGECDDQRVPARGAPEGADGGCAEGCCAGKGAAAGGGIDGARIDAEDRAASHQHRAEGVQAEARRAVASTGAAVAPSPLPPGAPTSHPAPTHVVVDVDPGAEADATPRKCSACTEEPGAMPHEITRTSLRVRNICCEAEVRLIERLLKPLRSVEAVDVNAVSKMVFVSHCVAECCLGPERIVSTLNDAQLGASLALGAHGGAEDEAGGSARSPREALAARAPVAHAALLWLLLAAGVACEAAAGAAASRAVLVSCAALGTMPLLTAIVRAGTLSRAPRLDMRALMLVAVVGAVLLGEATDAALLVTLYASAQLVERAVMARVERRLRVASQLSSPVLATLASTSAAVPLSELRAGDEIAVRAGEQLPVDGRVVRGVAVVSEAAVTGEHQPVRKSPGDSLLSGSLVLTGYAEVRLDAPASGSGLAQIERLVTEAQAQRSPTQAAVDTFAAWWTPAVLVAALGVALAPTIVGGAPIGANARATLTLLLLACPCALVFATPVPTMAAIASAAGHGVLFKSAEALERLASVRALAVDKTGTLTTGHFAVVATERPPVAGAAEAAGGAAESAEAAGKRALTLAASVEARSAHPLSAAIVAEAVGCAGEAAESGRALPRAERFRSIEGVGVQADVELAAAGVEGAQPQPAATARVVVGNARALDWAGCPPHAKSWFSDFSARHADDAVLGVVVDGALELGLALNDAVRPGAAEAIGTLRAAGVPTTMLTGASAASAAPLAARLGLDGCHSAMLPADKAAWVAKAVAETRGGVAMLGDGINDAPALALATVGVAMGASGTALASRSAHVVLLDERLERLPQAVRLARRTRALVRANIALAIGVKIVAAALTLAGALRLYMAVLVDLGSLLLVLGVGTTALAPGVWGAKGARRRAGARGAQGAPARGSWWPPGGLRRLPSMREPLQSRGRGGEAEFGLSLAAAWGADGRVGDSSGPGGTPHSQKA